MWTTKDIGTHSISSIITNNAIETQAIQPTTLRKVLNSEFEPYLTSISRVIDKYQLHKALGQGALDGIPDLDDEEEEKVYEELNAVLLLKVNKSMDKLNRTRMLSSSKQLKKVPPIFSDPNFQISNPNIFSEITEYKDIIQQNSNDNHYRVLQDKLVLYSDTIQVQLLKEIGNRSASFFGALNNLQYLEKESQDCLEKIENLRASLQLIKQENVLSSLKIVETLQTKSNCCVLYGAVKLVSSIRHAQPLIKELINQNDYLGALDLVQDVDNSLKGHEESIPSEEITRGISVMKHTSIIPKNLDLRGINAIANFSSQLMEVKRQIANCTTSAFSKVLTDYLSRYLDGYKDTVSGKEATFEKCIASILNEEYLTTPKERILGKPTDREKELKTNISQLMICLLRLDRFDSGVNKYKEKVIVLMKTFTKRYYPIPPEFYEKIREQVEKPEKERSKSTEDLTKKPGEAIAESPKKSSKEQLSQQQKVLIDQELSKQIKQMTFPQFYRTIVNLSIFYIQYLSKQATINEILIDILKGAQERKVLIGCDKLPNDTKDEMIIDQEEEDIAKSFINNFHEEKSKQISLLLENEQWVQADIPIDFQYLIEQLQNKTFKSSMVKTPDNGSIDLTQMARKQNSSESMKGEASSNYLVVDGQKYYAVVSVLMFLKMLTDYIECCQNITVLVPEIINRIFESLKLFNSKVCQLILGAGAIRSAGLDNITAKHITLGSQTLGLVMAMIPYIKDALSELLNARQLVLLNDFEKILRDYKDHQNELFVNLINTMSERSAIHVQTIASINWDTPEEKDMTAEGISQPIYQLVTETSTLHKLLSKYLPLESTKMIMQNVFQIYNKKLEEEYKKLSIYSSAGKTRLLNDIQFFMEVLNQFDGIDGPGSQLEIAVNNIKIKDKRLERKKSIGQQTPVLKKETPKFSYNFGMKK
ncbi:hypothetical protein HK103_003220 [Boothiomyces macroporosus]|uniref:Vacuolar protein sorting-associated protein 54 n=1 Tax=Boothiomyces macroporosus TaxID=261099 RepID=A0AAD5Y6H5_9FUNG|nr:hypothetical protein HK103_003220 [Boothiomyces macroporosus]